MPAVTVGLKIRGLKSGGLKSPKLKSPKIKAFNGDPSSIFGGRAMKSPEDYETGAAVQGLGKVASPYYAQQYAQKGRSLRYDTATNTYR